MSEWTCRTCALSLRLSQHKQTERMPYRVRENEERLITFVHARL